MKPARDIIAPAKEDSDALRKFKVHMHKSY